MTSYTTNKPTLSINQMIVQHRILIEDWLNQQFANASSIPVYGSVDIRHSGFKIAPIDMNLFPAGFNNLSPSCWPLATKCCRTIIERYQKNCQRILIIPENHTRNLFYFKNLACLQHLLEKAGYTVRLGSLLTANELKHLEPPYKKIITLKSVKRVSNRLMIDHFNPDIILLNNDLSNGIPPILQNLNQPIYPALKLGWSSRLKSQYFRYYQMIVNEFATLINIDPWFFMPIFSQCNHINFLRKEGEDKLIRASSEIFRNIQAHYEIHQIQAKPFIVIKANSGTYGMNVITIRNSNEIYHLNRKKRTKMAIQKGGKEASNFILQEGIYSLDSYNNYVAEPVIYLMGHQVIGGFYRIHQHKRQDENLNTPGMEFHPMTIKDNNILPDQTKPLTDFCNRFYVYSVIARLSMLAASKENEAIV